MFAIFVGFSSARDYTVGGNTGWNLPPNPTFYSTWASQQNFQVGDVLVFNFTVRLHTVAEVSKAAYDSCNTANPLSPAVINPPARITLTTAGTHYFICTIQGHCRLNQSLAVVVTGPSTTPAPRPSATTPPPSASPALPTPPPSSSTTSPPPPTSTDAPSTPTAGGSRSAPPPAGSFAAPTAAVGLLTVVSIATGALLF